MSGRRDNRSRSPVKVDHVGRRRDNPHRQENIGNQEINNPMNPMMMPNMYQQGNMMMSGMYNMMMPNSMMTGGMMPPSGGMLPPGGGMLPPNGGMLPPSGGMLPPSSGMMPTGGVDMMGGTGMEIMQQQQMDMSPIGSNSMTLAQGPPAPTMDMGLMGGMMMDPNMMGMFPNMGQEQGQEKKEIVLKYCVLTPPPPGTPPPPCRSRPPGCRTIFVGGLPDKIRESIVRDIFERYGRIQILRLSKKNFCHIRFDREGCVDAAMTITGFHIKLTVRDKERDKRDMNKDKKDKDKKDTDDDDETQGINGCLHVDYALSRDDQNEYERRQRQALRVQQQQMQQLNAQQEALATTRSASYRSASSPPPSRIQPFSNSAVIQLSDKLKSEEFFPSTLPTLIAWLERGDCSKKNATQFYTMIQTTNSHIRRLYHEKVQAEDELQECKDRVKKHIQNIIEQLEQVAKVFVAATHQRVWDHFTKPQRKNIETWQKMTQEFNTLKDEFNEKFIEEGEYNGYSNRSNSMDVSDENSQDLKRENESLRFQLEAYKNEVEVIKADAQKEMEKFKAQFIARQALQSAMEKNPPLPSPIVKPPPPPPLPDDMDVKMDLKENVTQGCGEAKLIGIMSAFLQVHPQGASLDYVVSYVRGLQPGATQAAVHRVLQKHPDVFRQTTSGVGADIDNRWMFVAFADL